jgi:hypothetical protein
MKAELPRLATDLESTDNCFLSKLSAVSVVMRAFSKSAVDMEFSIVSNLIGGDK